MIFRISLLDIFLFYRIMYLRRSSFFKSDARNPLITRYFITRFHSITKIKLCILFWRKASFIATLLRRWASDELRARLFIHCYLKGTCLSISPKVFSANSCWNVFFFYSSCWWRISSGHLYLNSRVKLHVKMENVSFDNKIWILIHQTLY